MVKHILVLLGLLLGLVACGGDVETPAPDVTEPTAYPGPARPTVTSIPEGYPAPTEPALPEAYPAGATVWVLRPLGEQCVDPETYEYAEVDEAVAALEAAGVEVVASETVSLVVCEACDCPTSEHFRAQIAAEDLATAETLGWYREP